MPVSREKADYHEKTSIAEFVGNPLIAALPESVPQSEMLKKLMILPPHDKNDCFKDAYDRLQMLSRICTVHIPFSQDLFIARSLSRCINWGYVSRNPVPFSVTANALSAYQIDVTRELENYLTHTVFPISGLSVLGISVVAVYSGH